jgi:CheY-like chemotaxis protein
MARVLIVDDEPVMRELIEVTLEDAGHAVESVESGRVALERLAQHAYDLIVCDLHMPDRDATAAGVPVRHGLRRWRPLRGVHQGQAGTGDDQAIRHRRPAGDGEPAARRNLKRGSRSLLRSP